MSPKKKYIKKVVNSLLGESKLTWKPTNLTMLYRDGGWRDVRISVPFNNHLLTLSNYFKGEGTHQELFKEGFSNYVQDTYALSKGETYFTYEIYLKEMYTRISDFIKENTIDDEPNENPFAINEENILKKYARKGFNKLLGNPTVSEKFVEKMAQFIERRWDEVVNVTWTYDVWGEMIFTVYIDEDDGQPTHIAQHPLEVEIRRTLEIDWRLHSEEFYLPYKIKVINLNKDTKLRGSVRESIEYFDDRVLNKDWVDKVVKRMVDKTEVNLYMSDYDPWTTHSPWFGNVISPNFGDDRRAKYNISWFIDEGKHLDIQPTFARELIETYGFSTNGELKYFESEYRKQIKEKVKLLQIPFIEKRRKQKEEYSKRYNINESRKDIKREQDDIERAVQDLNRHHNFNVSYDDIVKEIKKSTPEKITDEIWGELQNTESNKIQFGDFNSVFNLSNKYNKSNPLKLKKKIEHDEYKYPIILRFNDQYHLVSGNTRLCTAAAMGEYLDVIIADINKPFPVDENKKYKKSNV